MELGSLAQWVAVFASVVPGIFAIVYAKGANTVAREAREDLRQARK